MNQLPSFRKSDLLKGAGVVAVVLALGLGTAFAGMRTAANDAASASLRPLTISHAVHVERAFGPDDEDCVWASRKTFGADGASRTERKLECAE